MSGELEVARRFVPAATAVTETWWHDPAGAVGGLPFLAYHVMVGERWAGNIESLDSEPWAFTPSGRDG